MCTAASHNRVGLYLNFHLLFESCSVHMCYSLIYISMHSICHSLCPRRFLSHPKPKPVHSGLVAAALATVFAVELRKRKTVALYKAAPLFRTVEQFRPEHGEVSSSGLLGRGRNQLLL